MQGYWAIRERTVLRCGMLFSIRQKLCFPCRKVREVRIVRASRTFCLLIILYYRFFLQTCWPAFLHSTRGLAKKERKVMINRDRCLAKAPAWPKDR